MSNDTLNIMVAPAKDESIRMHQSQDSKRTLFHKVKFGCEVVDSTFNIFNWR